MIINIAVQFYPWHLLRGSNVYTIYALYKTKHFGHGLEDDYPITALRLDDS